MDPNPTKKLKHFMCLFCVLAQKDSFEPNLKIFSFESETWSPGQTPPPKWDNVPLLGGFFWARSLTL